MKLRRAATMIVSSLAVVALTPLAGQVGAADARPASAARFTADARVFTANIASGSKCDKGNTGSYDCMSVVDKQVTTWHPDAISVDEACYNDKQKFMAKHPGWDSIYVADASHASQKCGKADPRHGNFIAAPKLSNFFKLKLDNVHHTTRTMYLACAQAASFWICTVHLPFQTAAQLKAMPNVHKDEINEIADKVESLDAKVAVCGDFNMRSGDSAFDRFRTDGFKQGSLDNTGEVAFDHIWWHEPGATVAAATSHAVVQPHKHFDHDLLEGRVQW